MFNRENNKTEHRCCACNEVKPITEYTKTGGKCKPCRASYDRARNQANGYSHGTNRSEAAAARKRRWQKANRDPAKERARRAVRSAILSGALVRPDVCSKCKSPAVRCDGVSAIQAHHENGYDRPLDIVWLCPQCHKDAHEQSDATLQRDRQP